MKTIALLASLSDIIGNAIIPIVVILLALTFVFVVKFIASRYKKVAPNAVGIFYGRNYTYKDLEGKTQKRGFHIVTGGGRILVPFVESYQEMSTAAFQVEIEEDNIPNKDNVKMKIKGVATCKIYSTAEDVANAAQAFLGKNQEEIKHFIQNILKGHLRSIIGKSDIESLLRERDDFNQKVLAESSNELKRLGIEIITLVIQDIDDEYQYIDSLGRKAVAEAKKDADIKVAEAQKESAIKVSNAKKESDIVVADNAALVSEAEKNRDVKIAQYKATSEAEKAKADKAFQIADTEQEKILKVKQAERDAAEKEAQISVQEKEALRNEKELEASIVKPAAAQKQKTILEAQAASEKVIIEAEASKRRVELDAEAQKSKETKTGEGEASKKKAILTAEAEGEAAKVKMKLLGEAEGTQKMAEALAQMNEAARLILILDRLPLLFDKGGDAVSKVTESIFKSVAAPFGSIDQIKIVDMGGDGKGLSQFGSIVPDTVMKFFASLSARGIDFSELLKKFGIDMDELLKMVTTEETKAGSENTSEKK